MSNVYDENYGIRFGTDADYVIAKALAPVSNKKDPYRYFKHTFQDFGLYPSAKPVITPPEPKTLTVDIPGADGELDYTQSLTGDIKYNNRNGEFYYVYCGERSSQWDSIYHNLLRYVHGKVLRVILNEDPGGYYYGRFTVDAPSYENGKMFLTLVGNLYPYRYDLFMTTEDWIWDTFSFETGIIREYKNIDINSPSEWAEYIVIGSGMHVTPNIVLNSGSLQLKYTNVVDLTTKTVNLSSGDNLIPDLVLIDSENILEFMGNGNVSIEYKTGVL